MTIVCFPLLEACTIKTSPQGEGFQVSSGPLGPVSKVVGVFRNRDLPSTSR